MNRKQEEHESKETVGNNERIVTEACVSYPEKKISFLKLFLIVSAIIGVLLFTEPMVGGFLFPLFIGEFVVLLPVALVLNFIGKIIIKNIA